MFCVFNLKKIAFPLAAALLFLLIAGIILSEKNSAEILPASAVSRQERVLIIDAGHGGADGGALAKNGLAESGLNLAIALKLNDAAKLFGIKTVMTRWEEQLPYPQGQDSIRAKKIWDQNRRARLINSYSDAVVISIHQNTYPDPRPCGPQVFYGASPGSDLLAEYAQQLLNKFLQPESRRLAAPAAENIFLMKSSKNTAVLVECGFISNEKELELLMDDSYQRRIAAILLCSYIQFVH